MSQLREPLLHTGITDTLPDDHPLAWQHVRCDCGRDACGALLHAGHNENMRAWVETGCGNYTVRCFAGIEDQVEPEVYALRGGGVDGS